MNKRIAFCTLSFLLLSSAIFGQLGIGLRGGINLSNQDWENNAFNISQEQVVGYNAALFAVLGNGVFTLQPELRLTRKGSELTLTDPMDATFRQTIESQIDYVEIPVLARLKFDLNSDMHLFVVAGPVIGFARDGSEKTLTTTAVSTVTSQVDLDSANYDKTDYGLDFGAGLIIEVLGINLVADVRYYYGLGDISKGEGDKVDVSISNQGLGISAGIFFPFGG